MNLFEMDPKATCTERNLFRWTQQAIWLHIITHQKGLLSENLSDIIAAMTEKSLHHTWISMGIHPSISPYLKKSLYKSS